MGDVRGVSRKFQQRGVKFAILGDGSKRRYPFLRYFVFGRGLRHKIVIYLTYFEAYCMTANVMGEGAACCIPALIHHWTRTLSWHPEQPPVRLRSSDFPRVAEFSLEPGG